MEAAHTLPFSSTRTAGGQVVIDGLRSDDETLVRLVREREDAGDNPDKLVRDALEIGARVLDREQTGVQADFVKAEFEKAARDLDKEFVERARKVAESLDARMESAFGAEQGVVTKALERHFGDASSEAVQHRVRAVVSEVAGQMREDLRKQFSSDSENNPLAGFQRAALSTMKNAGEQQSKQLLTVAEKLESMKLEIAQLRAAGEQFDAVAAEAEKGTAKGRSYEEQVYEALDAIACGAGDDCDAVGDFLNGSGGKKGDVVISIGAAGGPARARIVFEAKNSQLSKNQAVAQLDGARETRSADYAVLVVPSAEKLPARTHPLREYNGDKLFVVYDPDSESTLALEVAYQLARARVLMRGGDAAGLDADALNAEVEKAVGAMEDVRRIKQRLTAAKTSIDDSAAILDLMATGVRSHLSQLAALLQAGGGAELDA